MEDLSGPSVGWHSCQGSSVGGLAASIDWVIIALVLPKTFKGLVFVKVLLGDGFESLCLCRFAIQALKRSETGFRKLAGDEVRRGAS